MSRSPSVMLDENQQSQSPSHTLGPNTILDSTKATTIPPVSPAPPPAASSSTIQQQQFPTWAQRTDTARHKRARVILTDPTIIYPLGSGCPSCVSKGFQCVAKEGYAVCARCTADAYGVPRCGVGFTPWRTVAGKKKKYESPLSMEYYFLDMIVE